MCFGYVLSVSVSFWCHGAWFDIFVSTASVDELDIFGYAVFFVVISGNSRYLGWPSRGLRKRFLAITRCVCVCVCVCVCFKFSVHVVFT